MLRFYTTSAFVLAGLLLGNPPQVSAPLDFLPVTPGIPDYENAHLPAVSVLTWIGESPEPKKCSGVLVDPLVVVTAAHCVCAPRLPGPEDKLPPEMPIVLATGEILADSHSLKDVTVTGIIDGNSFCPKQSTIVVTFAYRKPGDTPPYDVQPYDVVDVSIHPELKLVFGARRGQPWVVWNNADLAVIMLKKPVPFPPVSLPNSEVGLGAPLVIVGNGARKMGDVEDFGSRRFGDNAVTKLVKLGNGNVLIGAAARSLPDGGVPAHVRTGDSGGPCVRKDGTNVLTGITAMVMQLRVKGGISYFTSAFRYKDWILENIRLAHRPPDAGVSAPDLNAGMMTASGSDAGPPPSPPPVAR